MSQENVEITQRFSDASRRGDWEMLAATLDPHVFVRTDAPSSASMGETLPSLGTGSFGIRVEPISASRR
jgi:hypothetical protein